MVFAHCKMKDETLLRSVIQQADLVTVILQAEEIRR